MKKFLQKSGQWLAAFAAMFVVSTSAMAEDVTTTFNCQTYAVATSYTSVDGQVTLTQTAQGSYESWGDEYAFGGHGDCLLLTGDFTFAAPAGKYIKSIEMSTGYYGNYNYGSWTYSCTSGGDFGFDDINLYTWTGQKESVSFSGPSVWAYGITSISVTYGDFAAVPTFELGAVTPAPGEYAGSLSRITIAAPEGITFGKRGGNHYITVNGQKYNYPYGAINATGDAITFDTGISEGSEGEYTIVIPEEFVKGAGGEINVEKTLTYTLTYPFFSISAWGGVTPSQDETVKSLSSFSVSAPNSVTFEKVQNPTTLRLRGEYDNALGDYAYTDVPATVALVDGKAVFTFATPYTDKASLRFDVPAGVITSTDSKTNKEFSASFSVDPYEYFVATPSVKAWTTYDGAISEIVLTVPEDVEVATADGDIKVDGSSWMILDTEIDNANHTVTIYLDDVIEAGQHSIVIPQGYLKVSDYVVSRAIELNGVKVLGENDPFPYTAATPSVWSNITNQSLAEAPIVITFARELDGVDASKIGFQTPGGTKTAAEFNAEIPGAVTLTTEGKDLKIKFSDEFLASSYMDCYWTAQLYVQLGAGAVTCKASVNEENMWGIGFYYNCLKSFTMSAAEWCTMALTSTFEIPAGYTAYYVAAVTPETIALNTLATEGQTVNAYVPFLLNGPAKTVFYGSGNSDYAKNVPWGITNFLIGNYVDGDPCTYVASSIATSTNYWDYTRDSMMGDCKLYQLSYDNKGENLGFYTQTGTDGESIEVPQGKAFLVVPDYYTSSNSPKRFVFADGTVVTGLTAVEVPMGKDAIYNLQGQRVGATEKGGVYVKNGKKFIVK